MFRPNFNERMGKLWKMNEIYILNRIKWPKRELMELYDFVLHQNASNVLGFRMFWLKDGKEFKSSIGGIQKWRFLALALVNYDIWSCLKIEDDPKKDQHTHMLNAGATCFR
jgi:hypothetical protein